MGTNRTSASIHPDDARVIRLAREMGSKTLELNKWRYGRTEWTLQEIPPEVFELDALEQLDLSNQMITNIPDSIKRLTNLKELAIGVGHSFSPPQVLTQLPNLQVLKIMGNPVGPLPTWLVEMDQLRELVWHSRDLAAIPPWIKQLANLKSLSIWLNSTLQESFVDPDWLAGLEGFSISAALLGSQFQPTPPEWIGRLRNLRKLDLNSFGLEAIPEWLPEMSNIERLGIIQSGMKTVNQLATLRQLKSLNLLENPLVSVPSFLSQIDGLESLTLSVDRVEPIPEWISDLTHLKTLIIYKYGISEYTKKYSYSNKTAQEFIDSTNHLGSLISLENLNLFKAPLPSIPPVVRRLHKLRNLTLTNCDLRTLDDSIGDVKQLEGLRLTLNQLSALPGSLSQLGHLKTLDISHNAFTDLPDILYDITSLTKLNIDSGFLRSGGAISSLSPRFLELENLVDFDAEGNPFETPPLDVVAKGIDATRDYFRQAMEVGVDHLYEAKMLILGEPGAGKTTLAHKLQDPGYKLKSREKSTEGIEVMRWDFPIEGGRTFRVNIWDFGGQEIYHATHQFFLTKRSLYALVADNRKEDTDFFYWLNVVELLSDNSPLIILKNEKQDRHREINERQLRGEFNNLKETLPTNLATNRGLDDVVRVVKHLISGLPHVGSALPKTWVRVREELDRNPRNYISRDEFFAICQRNGFTRDQDKLQLSGHLHDLGVCLHFQEDPLLKKTVILKPKWGTDAVYKVLDNRRVMRNLGRFGRDDLAEIWSDPQYKDMLDELLQLMVNFRLCYKIPGDDRYIAPQRLTENQPPYDWDECDNMFMRFKYEFMPKGILTQFIVAMHPFIHEQKCVWKSGVVLAKDGARAEVIEHYGRREVRLRAAGRNKRDLMTIAAYELDRIHASYNRRLQYDQLIPCNCEVCRSRAEPHFFKLRTLRRYLADQQPRIQCEEGYRMVDVAGLIDDTLGPGVAIPLFMPQEGPGACPPPPTTFAGPVQNVVIHQAPVGDGPMPKSSKTPAARSAWANGSFYVFLFAVVVTGVAVLSRTVPWYAFPIAVVAALIFVPLIGVIEIYRNEQMSEKSFLEALRLVLGQLPLIGSLARSPDDTGKPKSKTQPKPKG